MLAVRPGTGERVVTRVLQQGARAHPDKKALRFEEADYSYADLWSRARRGAGVLRAAGVRQGDAVLGLQENTIQFGEAWLGCAPLGGGHVPGQPGYRGPV